MNKELLPYYERELIFVRKMAAEFAEQYPERAAALKLAPDGSDDPHVERVLQGFALIAGKIQHKLDEEFPEITTALLELMYPHLLRPVPAMAMLQFEVDPELSKQREGHLVPRETIAYSAPLDGVQCRLRTAYAVRLWPLQVAEASFGSSADLALGMNAEGARHALRLELQLLGGTKLPEIDLRELRIRIGGDQQAAHWMYEMLFTKVKRVVLRPLDKEGRPLRDGGMAVLGPEVVGQTGFSREEALLPVAETSFQGYRLMQEYFSYPQKFLFFDIHGLDQVPRETTTRFEVLLLMSAPEQNDRVLLLEAAVNAQMFQLGCTPAINLFKHGAEPIRLSHTKTEYPVVPDVYAPQGYEVYSVDGVVGESPKLARPKEYRPFYSLQHGLEETRGEDAEAFWFAKRAASTRGKDLEDDVYLSFVDRAFRLSQRAEESITVKVTCSNGDLASRLKPHVWGELDLESGAIVRTRLVDGPTRTLRPAMRGALQWRLISHLSLNHLSLSGYEAGGGAEALREILRLYDPLANRSSSRQIDGLTSVKSTRKVARMNSEHGFVFCPGVAIEAEMDEDKFSGGGAYLLGNVLDRFFGLYCALNSFTQLRVTTRQREGVVWRWPIRSGEQAVA